MSTKTGNEVRTNVDGVAVVRVCRNGRRDRDGRNAAIAEQMRQTLRELGVADLPSHIASTYDPLHVLEFAYERDPTTLTSRVEDTFIAGEVAAG